MSMERNPFSATNQTL